ncbi:hypothetical protein HOY80DRAFT_1028123 [Tuber brumale]|nr:hypothetical protein HOY80DRAFT_1028123 [Tuber brumale]
MEADDEVKIRTRNMRPHESDVGLDVCLIKNHGLQYEETFCTLPGLPWLEAQSLLDTTSSKSEFELSLFSID